MKRYHWCVKILAFFLAASALVVCVGSMLLTLSIYQDGLYTQPPEEVIEAYREEQAMNLAHKILQRHAATQLGQCSEAILDYTGMGHTNQELSKIFDIDPEGWDYRIEVMGVALDSNYSGKISGDIRTYCFTMSVDYPVHATLEESQLLEATPNWVWRDYYYTETGEYFLYYYRSPTYTVTIRMLPAATRSYHGEPLVSLEWLYAVRYWVIAVAGASLLIFILSAIYLCCAAGRSHRHEEIRLKGLTRLPLDVYGAAAALACVPLLGFGVDCLENVRWSSTKLDQALFLAAGSGLLFAATVVIGLWLYAVVAQIKMKNGSWWRKSLIGWCLRKLWKGVRFCFRGLRKLFRMLPLIWQWLVTAAAMAIIPSLCLFIAVTSTTYLKYLFVLWTILALAADIAMVCYGAYAFGLLMKGATQMSAGDLNAKISTKHLFGVFRDFADRQNSLADSAIEAAKAQMKSERMKSELITNVSHDIKTPLTSLINYVDLLEKPHTEEEGKQYLEVLSRQSQKLKKLIDDLMDMSKASSGAMHVEITSVDAAEAVNQALGEFADKLEAAGLTPLFRQPEQPVNILADGRLVWRVLSNLLGNIVKYALPGTRVYVDLSQVNGIVRLSIKNISKEELNVSAEELTERFVRGDASRNTEGSGLGLNIAKSLMELQQGDLYLSVDGDLFKVVLTFPAP